MVGQIHSIETFGTVDGPGIRFVLFVKGCPLRCAYCHNPDTWDPHSNNQMTPEEVLTQVMKYKNYYGDKGGITISGGEPLLQIDFLIELTSLCKKNGINTAVDTSGIVYDEDNPDLMKKFDTLIQSVDLFLLDIKQIDEQKHIKLTTKSNKNVLKFARYLDAHDKKMWIRHVLVPGITTGEEDLRKTYEFIHSLKNVEKVEVLPYHTLGVHKYKDLGIPYRLEGVEPPTKEQVQMAKKILRGEE